MTFTKNWPDILTTCRMISGDRFEITSQGTESRAAELAQQPAVVLEEYPEHLGYCEKRTGRTLVRKPESGRKSVKWSYRPVEKIVN
jgi:hypothetical protein